MEDERPHGRAIALSALSGALCAAVAVPLASLAGSPYLSSDRVNGWVVVFAIGFLVVFVAIPFALELRLRERQGDRDRRWEISVLTWGGIAVGVLALSLFLGSGSGFSGSSLAGTLGLISALESGIVVIAVATWLLAN